MHVMSFRTHPEGAEPGLEPTGVGVKLIPATGPSPWVTNRSHCGIGVSQLPSWIDKPPLRMRVDPFRDLVALSI